MPDRNAMDLVRILKVPLPRANALASFRNGDRDDVIEAIARPCNGHERLDLAKENP
jgi:hypothetical protein